MYVVLRSVCLNVARTTGKKTENRSRRIDLDIHYTLGCVSIGAFSDSDNYAHRDNHQGRSKVCWRRPSLGTALTITNSFFTKFGKSIFFTWAAVYCLLTRQKT